GQQQADPEPVAEHDLMAGMIDPMTRMLGMPCVRIMSGMLVEIPPVEGRVRRFVGQRLVRVCDMLCVLALSMVMLVRVVLVHLRLPSPVCLDSSGEAVAASSHCQASCGPAQCPR